MKGFLCCFQFLHLDNRKQVGRSKRKYKCKYKWRGGSTGFVQHLGNLENLENLENLKNVENMEKVESLENG